MLLDQKGQLVVTHGAPERDVAMELRVNEQLKSWDPLLYIRWCPEAVYRQSTGKVEGRYALACTLPQNHPIWEEVRQGKMPAEDAFESLGFFCEDLDNANSTPKEPEQMMTLIRERLGKCDNERETWKERMLASVEHNERRRQQIKEEAVEEAVDLAQTEYYHSSRAMRVFQSGKNYH